MLRIQILGAFGSTEVCVQGLLTFCCMLTPCRRWTTQMTERSLKRLNAQNRSNSGSWLLRYMRMHVIFRKLTIEWNASHSYRFGHISRTLRALQNSTKTSLRIDREGLLALQFLMPSPKPRGGTSDAFIEFRVFVLFRNHL